MYMCVCMIMCVQSNPPVEQQLLVVQSGYFAGWSTVEQTLALRYMTTIIFVDFNKAFDSIDKCAIPIVL